MKIELIHNTPLWVASKAIRKCWASEDKSDTDMEAIKCPACGEWYEHNEDDECVNCESSNYYTEPRIGTKDKELIERVGNKHKHKSTLEHLVYSFDIDGISRACLQELARHRMASYSVKSTRYTLKELKNIEPTQENLADFVVMSKVGEVNKVILQEIRALHLALQTNTSNDQVKYMLPEAYKTSLVMTINARSLQNFLELRTSKSALWEIQDLARAMYEVLPDEHKYLFKEYINEEV